MTGLSHTQGRSRKQWRSRLREDAYGASGAALGGSLGYGAGRAGAVVAADGIAARRGYRPGKGKPSLERRAKESLLRSIIDQSKAHRRVPSLREQAGNAARALLGPGRGGPITRVKAAVRAANPKPGRFDFGAAEAKYFDSTRGGLGLRYQQYAQHKVAKKLRNPLAFGAAAAGGLLGHHLAGRLSDGMRR